MMKRIVYRNKAAFLRYNEFRRQIVGELAPKECEAVFYLLPWLLSINHPACPGYVENLKRPFMVYSVDYSREIRKKEKKFKKMFGVESNTSLLKQLGTPNIIQGLYTIGSVGTVSQTSISDCDIWVCIEKKSFTKTGWRQLNEKINLVKDWLDLNIKIPVYFFISDVEAIREGRFGSVDEESSGSTQKNVLKEEFYRTCILICGKVPLWWLCFDSKGPVDYEQAKIAMEKEQLGDYDIIDFGNLERVDQEEYFGSALWQFHKSLTRPLKSIIKMILLKMLLDAPHEALLCHRFRERVLTGKTEQDYSLFTMEAVFEHLKSWDEKTLAFLNECFYLRCDIDPYNRKQVQKNRLANQFLKSFPIKKHVRDRLRKYNTWEAGAQIELGNDLFKLLLKIYQDISKAHGGAVSESDKHDLTILGMKISACCLNKKNKISVLHKPTGFLNLPTITLALEKKTWKVFPGNNFKLALSASTDIIAVTAFVVWNNLFSEGSIRMRPNPSDITLQEVNNLFRRIRDFFGTYDFLEIPFSFYLKKEHILKLLVIVGFDQSPWEKGSSEFNVVYMNNWGELFVNSFGSYDSFSTFLKETHRKGTSLEKSYYVRRNSTSYEKIIERTKNIVMESIEE
jgi:adenylate cyclase, class 1